MTKDRDGNDNIAKKTQNNVAVVLAFKNAKCCQQFVLLVEKIRWFFSNRLEKPVYCRECFVPPTRNNW
jgi:hypothetical protein